MTEVAAEPIETNNNEPTPEQVEPSSTSNQETYEEQQQQTQVVEPEVETKEPVKNKKKT